MGFSGTEFEAKESDNHVAEMDGEDGFAYKLI